jgi:PAS domain-containing protein
MFLRETADELTRVTMALASEFPTGPEHRSIPETQNRASMKELAAMVQLLFHVAVSYIALVEKERFVFTRIGSGMEYWKYLRTYPLDGLLSEPLVVRDALDGLPEGTDFGDLRFAAAAPLRTADGLLLGFLIIADISPRPNFSSDDLFALGELARVLATNMELSMLASEAIQSEFATRKADERFRSILDAAPALILRTAPDGYCSFLSENWVGFVGRTLDSNGDDDWLTAIHSEDRVRCSAVYWEAVRKREPFSMFCGLRRFDGEYRPMLIKGVPEFGAESMWGGFVIVCVELTGEGNAGLPAES